MTASLRVERFTDARIPALRAFNQRLASGGAGWRFPEDPRPEWLNWAPRSEVFQELFLLMEGETVRGGYVLKHQPVSLRGDIRRMGNLYMPLSEGTINRAYSLVGARLFSDALRRESLLFAVGLGGTNAQVTSLVRALGWELYPVPFFFKVLNGTRFLRHIRYLRTTSLRKFLLDLAATSGAGWLATKLARALLSRRPRTRASLQVEVVERFSGWADDLWHECAARYSFVAVRTAEVLNRIYPPGRVGVFRLRISSAGRVIGYAVVQEEESLHSEFMGEMRVGTIVDTLARPDHAEAVIWLAARELERRGVDVIISNHSHPAWGAALRRAGFLEGPSHCIFAAAKRLAEQIRSVDPEAGEIHLNRGDGDWPWGVNLRMSVPSRGAI
jgi:hypothetical protein